MNLKLHKLMLELDRREFYSENYFEWTEEQKKILTEDLILFFRPILELGEFQISNLLFGLLRTIEECEEIEDYEQADILNRLYEAVKDKTGIDDIYKGG